MLNARADKNLNVPNEALLAWQRLQPNLGGARILHIQSLSRRMRQVDNAIFSEGTAIGDLDFHRLPIGQISDLYFAAERQAHVSCRESVLIVSLSTGGSLAVKLRPIP